jgi:hypothetical protein
MIDFHDEPIKNRECNDEYAYAKRQQDDLSGIITSYTDCVIDFFKDSKNYNLTLDLMKTTIKKYYDKEPKDNLKKKMYRAMTGDFWVKKDDAIALNIIYSVLDEILEEFIKKNASDLTCESYTKLASARTNFLEDTFANTCIQNPSECASFHKNKNPIEESACILKYNAYDEKNLELMRETYKNSVLNSKYDDITKAQALDLVNTRSNYEVQNFGKAQFKNDFYPNVRKKPIHL